MQKKRYNDKEKVYLEKNGKYVGIVKVLVYHEQLLLANNVPGLCPMFCYEWCLLRNKICYLFLKIWKVFKHFPKKKKNSFCSCIGLVYQKWYKFIL